MKKDNKANKGKIIRDIRNNFGQEKKDNYKPIRVGNFWAKIFFEYERNEDNNKTLSTQSYLNKLYHI